MVEEEVTTVVADNGSGMCKTEYTCALRVKEVTALVADAPHAVISFIVGRHNMPGIMVGMDQKDSNSSDEVQSKRCNCKVSVEADEWLSNDLQIDRIIDEV